jgi:uncharacterized protein (DUF433 family)
MRPTEIADESLDGDEWDIYPSPAISGTVVAPEKYDESIAYFLGTATARVPSLESRIGWGRAFRDLTFRKLKTQQWVSECIANGYQALTMSLDIDPDIRGGVPVLKGTGFTASQALAELADTSGVLELSMEFEIDPNVVKEMLNGLSLILQRPCHK